MKSQSAMEYLLTYGWAILIIAIVIAAFFELGLFNPYTFSPKAQPGSCYVVRPTMTGSVAYVSLQGTCTNEIPQSVASFDGNSSGITMSDSGFPTGSSARSDFIWVYVPQYRSMFRALNGYGYPSSQENVWMGIVDGKMYFTTQTCGYLSTLLIPEGKWSFIGYNYSSGASTVTVYVNNQSQTISLACGGALTTVLAGNFNVSDFTGLYAWLGFVANMQFYNTSLSQADVQALYKEGVGGAPIDLQDLVGWWPLNGNSNDYSGNNNGGTPTNVTFTSNWEKGYTAP